MPITIIISPPIRTRSGEEFGDMNTVPEQLQGETSMSAVYILVVIFLLSYVPGPWPGINQHIFAYKHNIIYITNHQYDHDLTIIRKLTI